LALRVSVVLGAIVVGVLLATATLPSADHLQDHASEQFGLDSR
jgi:hypothetical protein